MKKATSILIGTVLSLTPCLDAQSESTASKIKALYQQGLHAVDQGQMDIAKQCFQEVLRLQPSNANALYQLKALNAQGPRLLARKREQQMKAITIPAVDFEGVTLNEALDTLNALVKKHSNNKFIPNFVVQDPQGLFAGRTFDLKLGGVPASVILQYALDHARATARYDQHAIVIRPMGGAKGSVPSKEITPPARSRDPFAK